MQLELELSELESIAAARFAAIVKDVDRLKLEQQLDPLEHLQWARLGSELEFAQAGLQSAFPKLKEACRRLGEVSRSDELACHDELQSARFWTRSACITAQVIRHTAQVIRQGQEGA